MPAAVDFICRRGHPSIPKSCENQTVLITNHKAIGGFSVKSNKDSPSHCSRMTDDCAPAEELLAPHTFDHYLALFGAKRNKLGVAWYTTGEPGEETLHFRLLFDGEEPEVQGCIYIFDLLKSVYASGLYYIHNCTCRQPGCAGFTGGTVVVHASGLVLWKTDAGRIEDLYLFEYPQFREEILQAAKEALTYLDRTDKRSLALDYSSLEDFAIAIKVAEDPASFAGPYSPTSINNP